MKITLKMVNMISRETLLKKAISKLEQDVDIVLALKNMKNVLNDNGYMIIYDAISKNKIENTSPHAKIRNIEYIRKVLSENNMEIEACIPIYFFSSNPFDIDISQTQSVEAINIFNLIQILINQNHCNIKGENKKIVLEYLYYVDKLCLSNYKYGLSEKLLEFRRVLFRSKGAK